VAALSGSDFVVAPEAANRLGDRVTRVPDLAIWRRSDLKKMDRERTIVGGPLIAIEVVSSETAQELDEKIGQYFTAGTTAVWVIYPKNRTVVVERPDGNSRLKTSEVPLASEILSSLGIPVADVFSFLDDE